MMHNKIILLPYEICIRFHKSFYDDDFNFATQSFPQIYWNEKQKNKVFYGKQEYIMYYTLLTLHF